MPNTKSAIRRVRRVKKQTQINRIRKSKYKNAIKQIYTTANICKTNKGAIYLLLFFLLVAEKAKKFPEVAIIKVVTVS